MQAAAARVGISRLPPVARGLAFAAGLAARAAVRTAESIARLEALVYATGGITLTDILLYATATFEDVPPEPAPVPVPVPLEPGIAERIVTNVFGGMVVIAGAVLVTMFIADVVAERSRTRKERPCHPYALMGHLYRTSSPVPASAPAAPPPRRAINSPPLPRRAVVPFDASRAIAAWLQECEAAGIKHRMHQRK